MSTFSELQTILVNRTGADGSNYTDRIKSAINWAIREICGVKFWFMHETGTSQKTINGSTIYPLEIDCFHTWKFWLTHAGVKDELIVSSVEDILHDAQSSNGVPKYYAVAGMTTTIVGGSTYTKAVYVGNPTPNGAYILDYGYFKLLPDLSDDDDESMISIAYRDDPIIEGAIYKYWLDLEQAEKAKTSLDKFVWSMRIMEVVMPYMGAGYTEMVKMGMENQEK